MARRCEVTGKGVQTGNNVSHAKNRTRRRFLPNIQTTSFLSETLGEQFRLKLSASGIRTIEHKGGLDAYVMDTPKSKLPSDLLTVRRRLEKAAEAK